MKAPSKQRNMIGLLYDNPSRSFSTRELMVLLRMQSYESVATTVYNLRSAGAKIKTIMSVDETRYQIGQ